MAGSSLGLVFQYFFAVGSGVGLGLVITIGSAVAIYNKFKGMNAAWPKRKK